MIDSDLLGTPTPAPFPAPGLAGVASLAGPRARRVGLALVGIAIALVAFLAWRWSQQHDVAALHEGSERRLAAVSAALFAPIDKYSYLTDTVAHYPLLAQALGTPPDAALVSQANELLKRVNDSAKSAVIYVLNTQGVVIASSNWQAPGSFIGQDYSFRPYFRDALKNRSGRFYGMGTTSHLPGYYFSSAIIRDQVTVGVVVAKIDRTTANSGWNSRDDVAVTDANGVIILSSRSDWRYRPNRPLSETTRAQLQRTHQYDDVLKPALASSVSADLGNGEQVLRITTPAAPGTSAAQSTTYFSKSARLAGSDWTIHVLTPTDDISTRARWIGALSAAALAFFVLLYLYVSQVRGSMRERESARLALETAHGSLARQHRHLQSVSEKLRVTATTDPLTGAFNRRYFLDAVGPLLLSHRRTDGVLSVVMIDIDHFKSINDRFGHPAGDHVLRTLTALAREVLREADLFARFGGEEFIVALPNTAGPEAVAAAERLRERVCANAFAYNGAPIAVSISCGVAQHHNDAESVEETIRRADAALYSSKEHGRNRVSVG